MNTEIEHIDVITTIVIDTDGRRSDVLTQPALIAGQPDRDLAAEREQARQERHELKNEAQRRRRHQQAARRALEQRNTTIFDL